jgi:coenzyme PQQ precursor peptide PqqA
MSEWRTPEFEEIRMDAEINCYSSAVQLGGAVRRRGESETRPYTPQRAMQAAPRLDGRALP